MPNHPPSTIHHPPRVLIIAGSDSSGGAGIQADIKTVSMLGGYAMTAITALTAQNTQGVHGVHPVPVPFVTAQIRACLDDIGADAIKTGMLHNTQVIVTVADIISETMNAPSPACGLDARKIDPPGSIFLDQGMGWGCTPSPNPSRKQEGDTRQADNNRFKTFSSIPLILDPVMVATSGDPLLRDDAIAALTTRLIPLATVITPNIPEAQLLSGMIIRSRNDMEHAAQRIARLGAAAVLLKGGHLHGDTVTDLLWQDGTAHWFESPRIHTRHTHGTGCTLASALATELGKGTGLIEAIHTARAYVHRAIETAPGFGTGHGPLNHLHPLTDT